MKTPTQVQCGQGENNPVMLLPSSMHATHTGHGECAYSDPGIRESHAPLGNLVPPAPETPRSSQASDGAEAQGEGEAGQTGLGLASLNNAMGSGV